MNSTESIDESAVDLAPNESPTPLPPPPPPHSGMIFLNPVGSL